MAYINSKIKDSRVENLESLAKTLSGYKAEGKKIVLCHGVFDPLHIGHIRHFNQAKKLGDILVVTVTPDKHVNKGPHRPAFTEDLRVEAIAALNCVDFTSVNAWPTAEETIKLLRPDVYVKGSEYKATDKDRTGGIITEQQAVDSVGGKIAFTEDLTFSASTLVNRFLPVFPEQVSKFLTEFTEKYSIDNVVGYLEQARGLKVLIVGETIIDEYIYCQSIGKSGKEPVLATLYQSSEKFAGGIIAIANHASAFCDKVETLTFLGGASSQEDFVREKMAPNVGANFLYLAGSAPTIVKKRFLESYPFQKLFELYEMDEDGNGPDQNRSFCDKLKSILPDFDVVIVTDYGHGMITPEAVEVLCSQAKFLAVNTQINAGNRGFNTISKYRRADYICLSESEIRLEARSRTKDVREIITDVAEKLSCDYIVTTRGQAGSLCYSREDGFFEVPAFAVNVVDRIGAGDAVLSLTSLCAVQKAPIEVSGFIGNVAGSQAVNTVGHRESIEGVSFFRYMESLLK